MFNVRSRQLVRHLFTSFVDVHREETGFLGFFVFSMVQPGDWQDQWGGGTDILVPKDVTKSFNYMNAQVPYDQTDMTATVPYKPNQAMIFVKTHNSLHGVREMSGPEGVMRRTLTVVIERG